jgi:plastocyanin
MKGLPSLLGLAAGLVLAAPAAAADKPIAFANYAYNPADTTIKTGDTATFSGAFGSHPLVWDGGQFTKTDSGSSKAFSFSQPGTYLYHCDFHAVSQGMTGVLRVVADQHPARVAFAISPAPPTAGQPVTFTYSGDPDPDGTLTRWEWDLDGDGSFETSTASPAASTTFPAAGTVTVRMRAIDDSNEASAVAEQAVSVAKAGAPSPGAGSSTVDRTAPRVTRVSVKGLTVTFRATERAAATAVVRVRGKTVARGTAKAGHTTVHLRLTAKGRTLLRRGKRVKATLELTLRDASANTRTTKRKVTLRRR